SHVDEPFRLSLDKHLSILRRQGLLESWHDGLIPAGSDWDSEISRELQTAEIILLLISADFLASDYCWSRELALALERHRRKEARVVPIIIRPSDWSAAPFSSLQALPRDGRPIDSWPSRDEAFVDVVQGVRRVCQELSQLVDVEAKGESAPS